MGDKEASSLWVSDRLGHQGPRIELKKEFRGSSKEHPIMLDSKVGGGVGHKNMWTEGRRNGINRCAMIDREKKNGGGGGDGARSETRE